MLTRTQFRAYEAVRRIGVTNMYAIKTVEDLTGLTTEQVKYCMGHFAELAAKYGTDVSEYEVERIKSLVE